MENFNLEEFKNTIKKYNEYKNLLRNFISENRKMLPTTESIDDFSYDGDIIDIEISDENNIKISGINYYDYGEYSSVDIAFPIEYITDKDKVKKEITK